MSVNKVFLLGNLGQDPELRYTQSQSAVCTLSLATGERRKNAEGEWVDHTEWHSVVVWGKQAENCGKYLSKGSQAHIEGRLQTRKWQDKDGNDRYTTEIVATQINFVGSKGERSQAKAPAAEINPGSTPFEDDEVPF